MDSNDGPHCCMCEMIWWSQLRQQLTEMCIVAVGINWHHQWKSQWGGAGVNSIASKLAVSPSLSFPPVAREVFPSCSLYCG